MLRPDIKQQIFEGKKIVIVIGSQKELVKLMIDLDKLNVLWRDGVKPLNHSDIFHRVRCIDLNIYPDKSLPQTRTIMGYHTETVNHYTKHGILEHFDYVYNCNEVFMEVDLLMKYIKEVTK